MKGYHEGKEYESGLLGQVKKSAYGKELVNQNQDNPEIKAHKIEYILEPSKAVAFFEHTHIPFEKALAVVKKSQPWEDPHNPRKLYASLLVNTLDHYSGVSKENIFYYTAVDSALDKFHNVDYFIVFKLGDKEEVVKVDVTMQPNKAPNHADLVLVYKNDVLENRKSMEEFVGNSATSIINLIVQRQNRQRA